MRFLFIAGVLAGGLLALAWANGVSPEPVPEWDLPDPALDIHADRLSNSVARLLQPLVGTWDAHVNAALRAASRRLLVFVIMVPLLMLLAVAGVLAGLFLRESARSAARFSSPTYNYVGKRLATVALVTLPTLPVIPLPVPAWTCYFVALLFAGGLLLYVTNLPVRV